MQFDGFTKTLNLKNSFVGLNEIKHSHTGTHQKYTSKNRRRERLLFLGFTQHRKTNWSYLRCFLLFIGDSQTYHCA